MSDTAITVELSLCVRGVPVLMAVTVGGPSSGHIHEREEKFLRCSTIVEAWEAGSAGDGFVKTVTTKGLGLTTKPIDMARFVADSALREHARAAMAPIRDQTGESVSRRA
jgi:hypothetical protein